VKRQNIRKCLWLALAIASSFAAWSWFRPYAWGADPAARCSVIGTQVKRDQDYFWVETHLKMTAGQRHDLTQPIYLISSQSPTIEPADTTLASKQGETEPYEIWLKFWLTRSQLEGPLTLAINGGKLSIKGSLGVPEMVATQPRYFVTHHW
jgi:hypothetical protein